MNAEQFSYYLKNNEKLHELSYQSLSDLTARFPYCQNLRWLVYQKSRIEANSSYQKDLHLAALYARDRQHFYKLVQKQKRTDGNADAYSITENGLEIKAIKRLTKQDSANVRSDIDTWSNPSVEGLKPKTDLSNPEEPNIKNYIRGTIPFQVQESETDVMLEFNLEDELEPEEDGSNKESPSSLDLSEDKQNILFLEDLFDKDIPENSLPSIDNKFTDKMDADADIKEEVGEENTLSTENFIDKVIYKNQQPTEELIDQAEKTSLEEKIKANSKENPSITGLSSSQKELSPKEGIDISVDPEIEINEPDIIKSDAPIVFEINNTDSNLPIDDSELPDIPIPASNENQSELEFLEEEKKEAEDSDYAIAVSKIQERSQKAEQKPKRKVVKRVLKPAPKSKFSSWVQQFQNQQMNSNGISVGEQEEKVKKKSKKSSKKKAKSHPKSKKKKKRTSPSIEFLEESVKKSKKKKKKKKDKIFDLASRSIRDDEEIASETLAELLANQGSYHKAIRMYRKLQLIIPSKSSFFAKQIEKLIKKID